MTGSSTVFKNIVFGLAISAIFLLSTPSLSAQKTRSSSPKKLTKVRLQLKWKHQFQFAGYYAALEKGYYQRAGLDVEILEVQEGVESIDQVVQGKAEFGIAMSDLLAKRAKGSPVVALAAIYQHSPLVLLATRSSGIENIHDFIGKNVALEDHAEELLAYLHSENISSQQLNLYAHQFSVTNLIDRKVDAISAYSTDEPYLLLKEEIPYSIFSPRSGGIDFYGDTLFTSEEHIDKYPEIVEAFLHGSLTGWKYALENHDEIIDLILSKYSTRHSRSHLEFEAEKTARLILPEVVELGYMNPGRWQHIANTLKSLGQIPQDFSLQGFLYQRNPKPVSKWLYIGLAGTVLFSLCAFLITARFFRLNLCLKEEMNEREKIEQDLKDNERKLTTLLSNLPGMAYRCLNDQFFTMQFVSMGCEELTGYCSSELLHNRTIAFAELIHEDDREMVFRKVTSAVNDLKPFRLYYRIIDKSGTTKWMWEQGRGIFTESGTLLFLEGFIADISKQKRVEHEKEQLFRELQKAFEEVKTLSGLLPVCSHCKKVRDDKGYWSQIDTYIAEHSDVDISHSICPDCADKYYEEYDIYDKHKM